MRTSTLSILVTLAVGMNASPTGMKRDDATPALAAREPAFSLSIPNNIPVSGAFRNGITVTPKAGGGSIVTGNNNSTILGQLSSFFPFGFKRDDATPTLEAREPAFSVSIPNNIPVSGAFRNGVTVTPKVGGGSIVTSNRNSTLFGGLFGRDDASPTLEAREPAFSLSIPNNIPVSGTFRNGITVTPKVGGGSIVTSNRNSTLFGGLFGRDDASPTLEAREPAFSLSIPNNIPVSGAFRNGITVTPKVGGGSIVTGSNSTVLGQLSSFFPFGFKRDDATPTLEAREPAFSVSIPNNIPVSGAFRNGITVTPKVGGGSIVTSNRNSTLFGGLFGRDAASPTLEAREPAFSLSIPNSIPVSGAFRNGVTVTPKVGGGSIVTGNNNSTLLGQLSSVFPFGFKREE